MSELNPHGCQYREHKDGVECHKVCDPGQSLCPFHLMLTSHDAEQGKEPRAMKTPKGYTE